jgi:parallel beta-helix repeat protein
MAKNHGLEQVSRLVDVNLNLKERKPSFSFLISFFLILLFCGSEALAATYYVSPTGSDSNGGSVTAPFKTIQRAANIVSPGDIVYIRAGTYTGFTLTRSGATNNYITFQNYPGESPVISKTDTGSTATNDVGVIIIPGGSTVSWIKFVGLTVTAPKSAGYTNTFFSLISVYASGGTNNHIVIDGCTLYGDAFNGIRFKYGVTDSQIINNTIGGSGQGVQNGIEIEYGNSNILIDNNNVSYCQIRRSSSATRDTGIQVHASNIPAMPNVGITISNNTVSYDVTQGILVGWNTDKVWIKDNWTHHNGATGIQIEGQGENYNPPNQWTTHVIVEGNTTEYNGFGTGREWETGIWVDDSKYVLVKNNIVRHNSNGIYDTSGDHVIIRNNVVYDSHYRYGAREAMSSGYSASTSYSGQNDVWVNNTFYNNGGPNTAFEIGYYQDTAPVAYFVWKNNIVANSVSPNDLQLTKGTVGTLQMDYNNYYDTRALSFLWNGKIYNWTNYLTQGKDRNSITTNPVFNNVSANDFTLQNTSGAIDHGTFLTTVTSTSGSGTSVVVGDARYFQDGYGISGASGDTIMIGTDTVTVTDVNYTTNVITFTPSITWVQGEGVSYPYAGSKPDIGAYESGAPTSRRQ